MVRNGLTVRMVSIFKIYDTTEELNNKSAELIAGLISSFTRLNQKCTLVLSGGSTPQKLYSILAKQYKVEIEWEKVFIFWEDERYVPAEHPESNYKMASEILLSKINILPENINKINTDIPIEKSALEYEERIKKFFGSSKLPIFDIVLLGLGKDGHIASIFPGTEAEDEKKKWVLGYHPQSVDTERITLTLPVINNAKNVIFLISGETKRDIVDRVFIKKEKSDFPILKVQSGEGSLFYLMDKAAAGDMKTE